MIEELEERVGLKATPSAVGEALDAVSQICRRHQITSLDEFQASCRRFAQDKLLNVAVLGRFKAGKSSLLNHLIGRPLLPVGVIPITSAVTEVQYGAEERGEVIFLDGRRQVIPIARIGEFMSETQNPGNAKGVARVLVEMPAMERYRGIRFVDTPGLDSVFAHNTDASLDWLPNVGLALVAIGVDPPLSQRDLELIRTLKRYTPRIAILLTKVDLLGTSELKQVEDFVRSRLAGYWDQPVPLYPFSIRTEFEGLQQALEKELLLEAKQGADHEHAEIFRHKVGTLIAECSGYLTVALQAAEVSDAERARIEHKILGEQESLADFRQSLQLAVRYQMGMLRTSFEGLVKEDETRLRGVLVEGLQSEFPAWTRSLRTALESFEEWLQASLLREMTEVSSRHCEEFNEPVRRVNRRLSQSLQDFRNRLSERALEALGVPLRTTEVDFRAEPPRAPDIRVGKIFDRNWELLSLVVPMPIVKGIVKRHFERKVADAVFVNVSRLVSQWEEAISASLRSLGKEAEHRFDELVATIGRLIAGAGEKAPQIRADLECLAALAHGAAKEARNACGGR